MQWLKVYKCWGQNRGAVRLGSRLFSKCNLKAQCVRLQQWTLWQTPHCKDNATVMTTFCFVYSISSTTWHLSHPFKYRFLSEQTVSSKKVNVQHWESPLITSKTLIPLSAFIVFPVWRLSLRHKPCCESLPWPKLKTVIVLYYIAL